jgi:hypothetical protein
MQLLTAAFLGLVLLAIATAHFVKIFRDINDPSGPPGPTLIPYLGRMHDLPIDFMWLKFKEWADKYGRACGFYRTEMLGAKFLIVTNEKVAEDMLVKRAKFNSDRPMIRSLFDSKSEHGSGEYLPLMGRNRKQFLPLTPWALTDRDIRILVTSKASYTRLHYGGH